MPFVKFGLDDENHEDVAPAKAKSNRTKGKSSGNIQSQDKDVPKAKAANTTQNTLEDVAPAKAKPQPTKRKRSGNSQSLDEDVSKAKAANRAKTANTTQNTLFQERNFENAPKAMRKRKDLTFEECKNDLNYLFYIRAQAQRIVKHAYLTNYTLNTKGMEHVEELPNYVYPNCGLDVPRPIYYTKKICDSREPCYMRTTAHEHYRKRLAHLRTSHKTYLKANRHMRKLAKEGIYHNAILLIAERIEKRSDPHFYGNYDFFYTGGNLCTIQNEYKQNVFHVEAEEKFNTLKLSSYSHEQSTHTFTLEECQVLSLNTGAEIFEIAEMESRLHEHDMLAVRQYKCVTLIGLDRTLNELKPLLEIETKKAPWISMAQSLERPDIFVLSNMKQQIRIYDINNPRLATKRNAFKIESEAFSSWNRLQRLYGETFLYANQHQLMIIDLRTTERDWLKTECKFSKRDYLCESNTTLAPSKFDHLFYVGTTHTIRCLDARLLNRIAFYEQTTIAEWTHQLDYPPIFLDTHYDKHKQHEYLVCASPVVGDIRLCELLANKSKPDENATYASYCLPWQPPTILETYDSALLAGKVLQPQIDLNQRIRACTTGLCFANYDGDLSNKPAVLMYTNSNGDVYAQTLKSREDYDFEKRTTSEGNAIMEKFAQDLTKLKPNELKYTEIVDFSDLAPIMLQPNEVNVKAEPSTEAADCAEEDLAKLTNSKRAFGRWRKSFAVLKDYKDALVPDLLSIWDIPDESECDVRYSTLQAKFQKQESETNVLNWLQKNDPNDQPTITIPASILNIYEFQAQAQSTQILAEEVDFKTLLNESDTRNISLTRPAKPKPAKAKKKHVKGF